MKLPAEHMHPTENPNCDGYHCNPSNSEVRVLPYPGGNLLLCRTCFDRELAWRRSRNRELAEDCRYDLPAWESLEVYEGAP